MMVTLRVAEARILTTSACQILVVLLNSRVQIVE